MAEADTAGAAHALDELTRNGHARFVMLCEALEDIVTLRPLLEHERGGFVEVALDAAQAVPGAVAGEDEVENVAELVKEEGDLVVLEESCGEARAENALGDARAVDARGELHGC